MLADVEASQHIFRMFRLKSLEKVTFYGGEFEGIENQTQLLLANENLKTLALDGCIKRKEDFAALARQFKSHPRLTNLSLRYVRFQPNLLASFMTAVLHSQTIETLDLSDNVFQDRHADPLKKLLSAATALTELNLSDSSFSLSCARALGEGMANNRTLLTLNMEELNYFGSEEFIPLIKGLSANDCLEILLTGPTEKNRKNVGGNRLSGKAVEGLCHFLRTNTRLRHLDLTSFDFDLAGKARIAAALQLRKDPIKLVCHGRTAYANSRAYLSSGDDRYLYRESAMNNDRLRKLAKRSRLVTIQFI